MYKLFMATIAAAISITANAQVSDRSTSLHDKSYFRGSLGTGNLGVGNGNKNFETSNDIGFSLIGGYQHNRHIAFELGYYDFGEANEHVDYEYGDLEMYGREGRTRGNINYSSRALGASVRLHTDRQNAFYIGLTAGYQYWGSSKRGKLIDEFTIDFSFFDEDYPQPSIQFRESGFEYYVNDNGHNAFYGAFATWNSPIGELGLEYTQFELDDNQPSLLAGSYTYRF